MYYSLLLNARKSFFYILKESHGVSVSSITYMKTARLSPSHVKVRMLKSHFFGGAPLKILFPQKALKNTSMTVSFINESILNWTWSMVLKSPYLKDLTNGQQNGLKIVQYSFNPGVAAHIWAQWWYLLGPKPMWKDHNSGPKTHP